MCLYGEIIDSTGAQTMLYLTCTMISSVDLAHNGVACAKDWVSNSVNCGTRFLSISKILMQKRKVIYRQQECAGSDLVLAVFRML